MITAGLKSGFGNQMWTYAITRAVAEINHYEWGFNPIPEYDYHNYNGVSQFDFMKIDYGKQHGFKYDETPPFISRVWIEGVNEIHYVNGDFVRFFPYQPEVFHIPDNTKLYISCCQVATYLVFILDHVRKWFEIKEEKIEEYKNRLKELDLILSYNTTIIHVRGGDYKADPKIILPKEYYQNAINIIRKQNPEMKFVCVTDDIPFAQEMVGPYIPVYSNSLGCDYFILNHAKNLIVSNSSFIHFPVWLNENHPFVIAPRYWCRYNISNGYWCHSDIWTFPWNFLDRDGEIYAQ